MVPSIDHLTSPKLGYCDIFHVEEFLEECKEIIPNQGIWVSILPTYAHVEALQQGMRIQRWAPQFIIIVV